MAKITQGKWTADIDRGHHAVVRGPTVIAYCGIVGAADDAESAANTLLIAASPELLEELKVALACAEAGLVPEQHTMDKFRAAITKATSKLS